jgi:hypothetical protein
MSAWQHCKRKYRFEGAFLLILEKHCDTFQHPVPPLVGGDINPEEVGILAKPGLLVSHVSMRVKADAVDRIIEGNTSF